MATGHGGNAAAALGDERHDQSEGQKHDAQTNNGSGHHRDCAWMTEPAKGKGYSKPEQECGKEQGPKLKGPANTIAADAADIATASSARRPARAKSMLTASETVTAPKK